MNLVILAFLESLLFCCYCNQMILFTIYALIAHAPLLHSGTVPLVHIVRVRQSCSLQIMRLVVEDSINRRKQFS